jgi:hypothetical protein
LVAAVVADELLGKRFDREGTPVLQNKLKILATKAEDGGFLEL